MRETIIRIARHLKQNHETIYNRIKNFCKRIYRLFYPVYPKILGNEIRTVKKVLKSSQWNMSYGDQLIHHELEEKFAEYIGTKYAVAVNTGGVAIQITLRALGLKPGDEVIHQVDTCVADAFAVMNAGATPIFSDISIETFMLSGKDLENCISKNTKVIMPVHIWGNPEDMDMVKQFAKKYDLYILEDSALAFGSQWKGEKTGSIGTAGIFSFGSTKPIQAGEGGMITTNDDSLAKELKTIRHWGDTTFEYGVRDQKILSWNGRMSEVVAAVALEQVRAYPAHLEEVSENVTIFKSYLQNVKGIHFYSPGNEYSVSSYSQVVVKVEESKIGMSKQELMGALQNSGIAVWHANFEPITSLSFFREGYWKDWILKGNFQNIEKNYQRKFENSEQVYQRLGLGFLKNNFLSKKNVKYLIRILSRILKR